jgi:cyclopropane-fatty-acyl-phospholipid synthase
MATQQVTPDSAVQTSLAFLQRLTACYHPQDFAVRFWDGTTWDPAGRRHHSAGPEPRFTLVLNHPGTLRQMFWPWNKAGVAEAYIYDDFDIEGDIQAFFGLVRHLLGRKFGVREKLSLLGKLLALPSGGRPHNGRQPVQLRGKQRSLERDRQAISYHYDLSYDFFALWLDRSLVYSCAYFTSPDNDLDTAQQAKLDYICRKLRLRPGERLLDLGAGWGGLVLHAVRHYGVTALGITLSRRQVEWGNERIRQAGLEGRCRLEYRDYRELGDADEPEGYDKLVSVGMIEHLGEAMMPTFFRQAWRLLRPGGVFLNHGITLKADTPFPRWTAFARRYVFPDGELRPITPTLRDSEKAGFEIRDVESLREHYALTLQHWLQRLEAHHDEACRLTDEATYRTFRLYLAGAMNGFQSGVYNLYQTLLAKPDQGAGRPSQLPLTRADWYV